MSRKLHEERASLIAQARAILDKAESENRDLTAEELAQYNRIDADIEALGNRISREQRMNDWQNSLSESANGMQNPVRSAQPGNGVTASYEDRTNSAEYRRSIMNYMSTGNTSGCITSDAGEVRDILGVSLTGVGATGAVLAPAVTEHALLQFLSKQNIMRQLATVRTSNTDIDLPYTSTHPTAYRVGEGVAFTASTPAFAKKSFKAYKVGALSVITHEALADMFINFDNYIVDEFGKAFADFEETDFVKGAGVTEASAAPTGVITAATSAVTTSSATAITADEILDLVYAVPAQYRRNGQFLMHDSTAKAIRKLKDSNGQYLWQPSMQLGQPDMLFGHKANFSTEMDAIGSAKKPLAFGDFSFYRIMDRGGLFIQRLNELYATSGQIGFMAYRRYDANLLTTDAVKVMTCATAVV